MVLSRWSAPGACLPPERYFCADGTIPRSTIARADGVIPETITRSNICLMLDNFLFSITAAANAFVMNSSIAYSNASILTGSVCKLALSVCLYFSFRFQAHSLNSSLPLNSIEFTPGRDVIASWTSLSIGVSSRKSSSGSSSSSMSRRSSLWNVRFNLFSFTL